MRRSQHDVEESGLIRAQVQSAVRVDIRFDSLEQSKPLTDRIVHPVDGAALVNGLGHRHATRDLQTVRMIRDGRICVSTCLTCVADVLQGGVAVPPRRMHWEVPPILVQSRSAKSRIPNDPHHLRSAEEVPTQRAAALDIIPPFAEVDSTLDGWRAAGFEYLLDYTGRAGADTGNLRQSATLCNEIGKRSFKREDGCRGPFIPKHLWLRRLREREIEQVAADNRVDVRVWSRRPHNRAFRAPKGRLGAETA